MEILKLRRRRESVASAYKKTAKFITSNTNNLLKIMPNLNHRKYKFLAKVIDEYESPEEVKYHISENRNSEENSIDSDLGERDLDYYLGAKKKENCWRDRSGKEQIERNYLIFHCGITEDDYVKFYKKTSYEHNKQAKCTIQPRLKQIPFKIHHKKSVRDESWSESTRFFKLFSNRRDSSSTSDSYSECDSNFNDSDSRRGATRYARCTDEYEIEGVRIKEVSEGRPCDYCPELCPGFIPHPWRKTCKCCGCDRLSHAVYHEELGSVRDRLGLRETVPSHHGLDSPPGLTAKQSELYWASLAERAPTIPGATGAAAWRAWRTRALAKQLPKQDLSLDHCKNIDEDHKKQFEDFVAARNEIALDIGIASQHHGSPLDCVGCNKQIRSGSIMIQAPRLGDESYFHPACFTCAECDELLVELAHCVYDGRPYCVRHYADRMKPRCHACDELIFSGEYTKAMDKDFHSGHFACWNCDDSLAGARYVLRDEHPYCIKCYESAFANGCEGCNKIIGIDSKDLSYKDKHWHEACFLCAKCRVSLVDKQFGSKLEKVYCGPCYDAQYASRCEGCGDVFRAGERTKKMEYKTRQWHEKCFCCLVCKNTIGTKSFIPREQEIYCIQCYEDKFATRCIKCSKIITQGGVTYKNEPWHRECFTCTNCNISLAGQRFTSRDEKPYCADCFGELFAKRCTACSKPITGIGGTRFISFEDRHWHNDCFICAQCKTSLVGKGFITDVTDIICPECAKQKLIDKTVLPLVANARDWIKGDKQKMPSNEVIFDLPGIFHKVKPKSESKPKP